MQTASRFELALTDLELYGFFTPGRFEGSRFAGGLLHRKPSHEHCPAVSFHPSRFLRRRFAIQTFEDRVEDPKLVTYYTSTTPNQLPWASTPPHEVGPAASLWGGSTTSSTHKSLTVCESTSSNSSSSSRKHVNRSLVLRGCFR